MTHIDVGSLNHIFIDSSIHILIFFIFFIFLWQGKVTGIVFDVWGALMNVTEYVVL